LKNAGIDFPSAIPPTAARFRAEPGSPTERALRMRLGVIRRPDPVVNPAIHYQVLVQEVSCQQEGRLPAPR
jgi:hypothetical protein